MCEEMRRRGGGERRRRRKVSVVDESVSNKMIFMMLQPSERIGTIHRFWDFFNILGFLDHFGGIDNAKSVQMRGHRIV